MKSFIGFLILLTIFSNLFAEQNCLTKIEIIELDSLVSTGQIKNLKELIKSKSVIETDTFFLNYQTQFFNKAKERLVLLENTINQFNQISPIVRNNVFINFNNNKNRFEDPTLNPKIKSLYKECIKSDSLDLCFIAQYYMQKHQDYLDDLLTKSDSTYSTYYDICAKQLNKIDGNLTHYIIDSCIDKIDSLLKNYESIIYYIKQHQKCLTSALSKYKDIIKSISEFNNYDDSIRVKLTEQIKTKENLYSIENAGKKSHQQFVIFKSSDPLNNQTIFNYLLAKKFKTEHILQQKKQMRNQIIEIKSLQNNKLYDEALIKLDKFRQAVPNIQVYKYFSDSLRYEYNKLEKEIKDQRYKSSFWISTEKINKEYQLLFGTGIQYNPPLMNLNWHFLSSVNSNSYKMPIYKLRESVGIQFSLEFSYHISQELLTGIHLNYGNIYITKAILSDSREISNYYKQETERINSYTIYSLGTDIFGKYYLRKSPGFMPYLKLSVGGLNFWRKSIRLKNLFNIKDIDNEEKHLYLIEKNAQEIYISPEFGIDFLKNTESNWILSLYFQTIFMSGGMNQMLGHFRGSAGIKFGIYK